MDKHMGMLSAKRIYDKQDVRERAAIAAMQCIIKELYGEKSYTLEEEKVARYSVCYADALVKKLKGE